MKYFCNVPDRDITEAPKGMFSILRLKMVLLLFLPLNIVIVGSVLPGYVPSLHVNVGLRSLILYENNQCQLFQASVSGSSDL